MLENIKNNQDFIQFLKQNQIKKFHLSTITEEGSNRNYIRISTPGKTFIFCKTLPFVPQRDDFFELSQYLISKKAKIPKIIDYIAEKGWLLLEDAGDTSLQEAVILYKKKQQPHHILNLYKHIIDELLIWQSFQDIPSFVSNRLFDQSKLDFEIDFFKEYTSRYQMPYLSFETEIFLKEINEFLSHQKEFVFTHRDFHSRNIILKNLNNLDFYIIDYQDARMGLRWYDLSSLLFDPYVELETRWIFELFDYYFEIYSKVSKKKHNKEYYKNLLFLQATQRLTKAIGSFFYLGFEKQKSHFRKYIIPALQQLIYLSMIGKFPDSIHLYWESFLKTYKQLYEN